MSDHVSTGLVRLDDAPVPDVGIMNSSVPGKGIGSHPAIACLNCGTKKSPCTMRAA